MTDVHIYEDMLGKVFKSVERIDDDEIIFTDTEDNRYRFYHSQDCCESVYIEDVEGDLSDLVGSPLLEAEEVTKDEEGLEYDIGMWTYYKFSTLKGSVNIRFYGTSNGYYSVSVHRAYAPVGTEFSYR